MTLDGKRLASGRDFDAATGRLQAGADVALLDEAGALALAERLEDQPFTVASVETRAHTERPKAPFITSTLQQEAGRKLGFSSARTMHVAQGLYERGLITYMRTDSTSLSGQAVSAARHQIASMYGDAYLPEQPREYRSKVKNAQEAHEAIRPAGDAMRTVDDVARELSGTDERRLYDLIWKRTVASQMADARIRRVTLRLEATSTTGEDGDVPGDRAAPSSSPATCAPTSKAPTIPRPSSKTARPSSRRSTKARRSRAASCARRATPRSRRRATPKRAW